MVHGVAPLLISAAAGYWVVTQAAGQKARVKKLGQILGWAIVLVSVAGASCKLYYMATGQPFGGKGIYCPWGGKACPFAPKSMPAPTQSSRWMQESLAFAKTEGVLDGKTFAGEIGAKGKAAGDKDEFIFKEGTFRSAACDPYHFAAADYTTARSGDATAFMAKASSPTDGTMEWNGTIQGNQIEGTATWIREGKQPLEHWFKGELQE